MSLCQGSPYANRRGRHADYLHGALVAVEARKRLSIKHVELDPVDAGVVGAGVSCAMVCIGHFCPDFMAIIDFRDDLHDLSLFLGRCAPRNVTELFAVCGDDVEPCRVLWDFGAFTLTRYVLLGERPSARPGLIKKAPKAEAASTVKPRRVNSSSFKPSI